MLNIRFLFQRYSIIVLNVLFQFILFRQFTVNDAGIISYGKTLFQYFDYSNLGIRNTLDKKKYKSLSSLELVFSYARTINLFLSIFLAVLLIVFSFEEISVIFFIVTGIFYADLFYVKLFYRNLGDKKIYVKKSFIFEIVPVIFLLLSIIFFKKLEYIGAIFMLSYIVLYYIFNKDLRKIPIIRFHEKSKLLIKKIIYLNFGEGFFIFLSSLLFFYLIAGDRIIIKEIYSFETVAQISFLMFFFNAFAPLTSAIIEINMKQILHEFSSKKILQILSLLILLAGVYLVIIFFIQNIIVDLFFPKYVSVKSYILMYSFLIFPYTIIQIFLIYLYKHHKQRLLFSFLFVIVFIHTVLLSQSNIFFENDIFNIFVIKLTSLLLIVGCMLVLFLKTIRNKPARST